MKKSVFSFNLAAVALVLAGCTGGTTYGTGTTHEEATMQGMRNIFTLRNEQVEIDYKPRPELVMPANKNVLPQPVQSQALTTDQNWPVDPEQRIAAVRGQAPQPDEYGNLPTEYLTDTDKPGISRTSGLSDELRRETRRGNVNAGSDQFIEAIKDDANGVGEGRVARERREQLAYSTGVKRKFLTEPPVEYRTPSATAEAGELGISDDELSARQAEDRRLRRSPDNRTLEPTGAN